MGTTEFIANRTERSPSASAREATAVFNDKNDTNTAEIIDIDFVIKFLKVVTILAKFKSFLSAEQILIPIKQFTTGRNILAEIKLSACDKTSKLAFTENDVIAPPLEAQIIQNAGKNAYVKSAQSFIVEHESFNAG